MILSIMIGILLPALIIAWGMKWNWTSFAPGTADGWLGFWGGYIGALIGALLAGSIAYFIAHRQINLQSKKDNERERHFFATQLGIQKNQEINTDLMEFIRENVILVVSMTEHIHGTIDIKALIKINESQQDKIAYLIRKLVVNEVFFEDLNEDIEKLKQESSNITEKVTDWIVHQQTPIEIPLPEDIRPHVIKQELDDLLIHGGKVVKSLNRILNDEIKGLRLKEAPSQLR